MKKIKFYKLFRRGPTKWGDSRPLLISFQKLSNWCCFLGSGEEEGVLGWGKTELEAAENLLWNLDFKLAKGVISLEETKDINPINYSNEGIKKDRFDRLMEQNS